MLDVNGRIYTVLTTARFEVFSNLLTFVQLIAYLDI